MKVQGSSIGAADSAVSLMKRVVRNRSLGKEEKADVLETLVQHRETDRNYKARSEGRKLVDGAPWGSDHGRGRPRHTGVTGYFFPTRRTSRIARKCSCRSCRRCNRRSLGVAVRYPPCPDSCAAGRRGFPSRRRISGR